MTTAEVVSDLIEVGGISELVIVGFVVEIETVARLMTMCYRHA